MATKIELTSGKWRGLRILSDDLGKFRMMAIDQRDSMRRMLSKVLNRPEKEIAYTDLANVKRSITKVLSPYSTATLTDPVYGYPLSAPYIPRHVGLLLAAEETGYEKSGADGKERVSRLIQGWSVEKAKRAGANAVKLLIYYRPEASAESREKQHALVRQVGEDCVKHDLPFLLETVGYPMLPDELPKEPGGRASTDTPAFAKRKPQIVAETAKEFSKPEYRIDILKLEFPADLKYTKEYAKGAFDGKTREVLYDLSEVKDFCRAVDQASQLPWVILSGGVDIDEFVENAKLATAAGASGMLCGRAIWKDCVEFYPNIEAMEAWLATSGVNNFKRLEVVLQEAMPWFEHRKFKGFPNLALPNAGEGWHKEA